jgi:hypothetical protein
MEEAMIPDIFHFVYGFKPQTHPFPLIHFLAIQSCIEVNRPAQVIVHCAQKPWGELWERLEGRITVADAARSEAVDAHAYDSRVPGIYRYAHHADFVRLEALIRHGGIYADIDTIFVQRFPDRLRSHAFVAGRETDLGGNPSVGNALMAAQAGSAFARRWLDAMPQELDGWSDHSTLLPARLAAEHASEIHLEPTETFYPFDHGALGLMRLLMGNETVPDGTVSIHLWEHLWGEKSRTDFVAFHTGLVTPANIRKIDTTLFRMLRRSLPEDLE